MTRFQQLVAARKAQGFHICVGLDTEWSRIPSCIRETGIGLENELQHVIDFNAKIAQAVGDIVCAFKPNLAFYEGHFMYGQNFAGERMLFASMRQIRFQLSDVPFIIDGKRGDIGNTNRGYVTRLFIAFEAEAITVSPYMGYEDSLDTFLTKSDKFSFVLCLTSNNGAAEFQKCRVILDEQDIVGLCSTAALKVAKWLPDGRPTLCLFELVAHRAVLGWNAHGNVGLVVGATHPAELARVCQIVAGTGVLLLIPGSKTQGGRLEDIIPVLKRTGCMGQAIINLSRDVIYASSGVDYAEAARTRVLEANAEIARLLETS